MELGYPAAAGPDPQPRGGRGGLRRLGLKSIAEARVGDTLTDADKPAPEPLPGYKQALPLVFAGFYPMRGDDGPPLREALDSCNSTS